MINIIKTTNKALIESILQDQELFRLTHGQDSSLKITDAKRVIGLDYLIAYEDNMLIGLFTIRQVTHVLIEGHIRILPQYWKTEIPGKALEEAIKYLKKTTSSTKVMTTVPGNCHHVIKFLNKHEFRQAGAIHEGIVYNNTLTSLIFFEKRL